MTITQIHLNVPLHHRPSNCHNQAHWDSNLLPVVGRWWRPRCLYHRFQWQTDRWFFYVYIKLYAACRHTHAPIDAVFEAFSKAQIDVEEISQITVDTYSAAIKLAGASDVNSPSAARFSIPFSVALALIRKGAGADKFSKETIDDPNFRQLPGKVRLSVCHK